MRTKKFKNFLTKKSDYDKLSKLLATKKVAKQIKKFLTIESDCDRLNKLSKRNDNTKENKKVVDKQQKIW